jgi:hypothetical protein
VIALGPCELLDAWEDGAGRPLVEQALVVLRAADPGASWDELAALDVAERERRLLALHERWLGPVLDCVADCPGCSEALEFALDAGALDAGAPVSPPPATGDLRFRLPDSVDLAAAGACADPAQGRRVLAARCVLGPAAGAVVDEDDVAAVAAAMERVAGLADTTIALTCPACDAAWSVALDLPSFVWAEVGAAVGRLMVEVDALARAYGWTEDAVLRLPPGRRRDYVELAVR